MLAPFGVFCSLALFCNFVTAIYTVNQDYGQDLKNFVKPIAGKKLIGKKFEPTWESLDSRTLPTWYDEAKLGIFIHWGVFSVPSFGSEWFWNNWKTETASTKYRDFMKQRYPPNFTYQDFAKEFTAEFYNATQWSEIFKASGAKYVVLTSKHHEGYTMWPSKYSFSWNSADVGPNKDLVGELAAAIRKNTDLKFGLYHSLYEWFNPLWIADKKSNFTTDDFVKFKILPELRELVELYKPEVVWSDGEWEAPDTYWKSKEFLAWLFNDSPVKNTVVVNDRWGHETLCHHGDFYTCSDRYNPGVLQPHKWENCFTIDRKSWGYRRNANLADYMSTKEMVKELVTTVSCGGNVLINVGPTKDGIIPPIYEQRLREIGDWLSINDKAIHNTKPWKHQNDTLTNEVWYTQSKDGNDVYGCLLTWPKDNILRLGAPKMPEGSPAFISVEGGEVQVKWTRNNDVTEIQLPVEHRGGQPAWVIRFHHKVKAL